MDTLDFLSSWHWSPVDLLIGLALAIEYLASFGVHRRTGYFAAALAIFGVTQMSALDRLAAGYLFSAHMLQHITLLLVVPALLLMSLPRHVLLGKWGPLGHPVVGWVGGVGAMWLWHAPALCNAAAVSGWVRAIQTVSLILLGILFWRQTLAPSESERLQPAPAILYLFSACVACSILGILITLAPVKVCPVYALNRSDALQLMIRSAWGITPDWDQQIGGLLMWVPMCLIYLSAIFAQLARWFGERPPILGATNSINSR